VIFGFGIIHCCESIAWFIHTCCGWMWTPCCRSWKFCSMRSRIERFCQQSIKTRYTHVTSLRLLGHSSSPNNWLQGLGSNCVPIEKHNQIIYCSLFVWDGIKAYLGEITVSSCSCFLLRPHLTAWSSWPFDEQWIRTLALLRQHLIEAISARLAISERRAEPDDEIHIALQFLTTRDIAIWCKPPSQKCWKWKRW